MDKAIIVDHLVKNFQVSESLFSSKKKTTHALKNVSFSVQTGEIVGIIGPTGAGKTTTLKTLSGLLYSTSGFVEVLEHNPWEKQLNFLSQISFITGAKNQLWWDLPATRTFELNRAIYEIPTHDYEENLDELTTLLDIKKYVNIPVRKLSQGLRTKMELAAALLHKPKVVFLDEPTNGLDLISRQKVLDFIYEYNKKHQTTIILTSRSLDDLSNLARRVIIMDEGRSLFDGVLEEILTRFAKNKIIRATLFSEDNIEDLEKIGKIKKLVFPEVVISVPRTTVSVAAAELLQNFPITDMSIEEYPIEDIVGRIIKK